MFIPADFKELEKRFDLGKSIVITAIDLSVGDKKQIVPSGSIGVIVGASDFFIEIEFFLLKKKVTVNEETSNLLLMEKDLDGF